jgi:hypothetical protein
MSYAHKTEELQIKPVDKELADLSCPRETMLAKN